MRIFSIFLMFFLLSMGAYANSCPSSKIAAWYVSSPADINILENKQFNLFFFNNAFYGEWSIARRNSEIQKAINSLDNCSQIILPIDNFLTKNWFSDDGMEKFMEQWGEHPKVYGFLLKDDVLIEKFPDKNNVNPNALWVYRWYYKMIRNQAETNNRHNKDLAPGKKIFVTIPFHPQARNSVNNFNFFISNEYNLPPDFLTPGNAWDVAITYWYPYRQGMSRSEELHYMNELHRQMKQFVPDEARMALIQVASEPQNKNDALKEEYDLSIQYLSLIDQGVLNGNNKWIGYFAANGHAGSNNSLLWKNYRRITDDSNIYLRESGKINYCHAMGFR